MGRLLVVGIGPGSAGAMTLDARDALERADVVCGYTAYIELVRDLVAGKELFDTPMRGEVDRCRWALREAARGRTVALISSGDAGVYGMAALALELAQDVPEVEVEVVCGVTAALSGAAVLGAPLGHDFCAISLSDLLTPWEVIERRLRAAAAADFCICLYNPASHRRAGHLARACGALLDAGKDPSCVCGWVRNIGREGQTSRVLSLGELAQEEVNMFTTVFIGSSTTVERDGRIVTPRGYDLR